MSRRTHRRQFIRETTLAGVGFWVAGGLALWTLFLFRPFPDPPRAPEVASRSASWAAWRSVRRCSRRCS